MLPEGTSNYQLLIYSQPVILSEGVGPGGREIAATIPTWIEPGQHTLVLSAEIDGEIVQFSTEVTVLAAATPTPPPDGPLDPVVPSPPADPADPAAPSPPTGDLPATGGGAGLVQPALMMLLAGALLWVMTRRRRYV